MKKGDAERSASVTKKWRKVMAVGCSHGVLADPAAIKAVLSFRDRFNPEILVHLGDALDMSSFMSKCVSNGSGDPIEPDIDGGMGFLKELRPTVLLHGNHEYRLDRELQSKNEIVSFAAATILSSMESSCNQMGCRIVPYTGNTQKYVVGNIRFMHGTFYNDPATRDHAEAFAPWKGTLVHAHTHRAGMATGRREDSPVGFCVGTLTRRGAMEYANTKKSTLSWSQAFVWGFVSNTSSQLFLCQKQAGEWVLPL